MKKLFIAFFSLVACNTISAKQINPDSTLYEIPASQQKEQNVSDRIQIGINFGFGYSTAYNRYHLDETIDKHDNALRSGLNLQASAVYFVSKRIGVGAMYSLFKTSESTDIQRSGPTFPVTDNITANFIAPSFWYRFPVSKKCSFMLNFSPGYFNFYNESSSYSGEAVKIKASTAGFYLGADADYFLSKNISAYMHGGFLAAYTRELDLEGAYGTGEVKRASAESFNRFNLGIGIRFHLF